MTNQQIGLYLGIRTAEARKIFDPIRQAFEEANIGNDIPLSIVELFENGSTPANYRYYLDKLKVVDMLNANGIKPLVSESALKNMFYDPWVMFQAAALNFTDEPLPKDFESLVLDPIKKSREPEIESAERRRQSREDAAKIIETAMKPLLKAYRKLCEFDNWTLAGSSADSTRITIGKMLFDAGIIDEFGNERK